MTASETTTTGSTRVAFPFSCVTKWSSPVVDMMLHGDHGAAWRRRQRRLRSWRHKQQRVSQWPCPQPATTASTKWRLKQRTPAYGHRRRTGQRLSTTLYGDRRQEQPGGRSSFQLFEEEPGGGRPAPLLEGATAAARRGASCRLCSHGANSRCSCAADGGTAGGYLEAH